jgi:hypothetical protein
MSFRDVPPISVDLRTGFVVGVITLAIAMAIGAIPALILARSSSAPVLADFRSVSTPAKAARWLRIVVAVEVLLGTSMICMGILFVGSFVATLRIDLGFSPDRVTALGITAPVSGLSAPSERNAAALSFFSRVLERVETIPGVQSAGLIAGGLPLSSSSTRGKLVPLDPGSSPITVEVSRVTQSYAKTLGIRTVEGRFVSSLDEPNSPPVIVINTVAAREAGLRVGSSVNLSGDRRIVGITSAERRAGPESEPSAHVYIPYAQAPVTVANIVWLQDGTAPGLDRAIREIIQPLLGANQLRQPVVFNDLLDRYLADRRFQAVVLAGFAIASAMMAAVGIVGLSSFLVVTRRAELSVKRALGASHARLVRDLLRGALVPVGIGVVSGVGFAKLISSLISLHLYGSAAPIGVFLGVGGLLLALACMCSLAGARFLKSDVIGELLRRG